MRQLVLDTETTGLEPSQGHRVIEIGCVELINRRPSGRHYHQYLRVGRDIDPGACEVHGITSEFLRDKPQFADVAEDFLEFVRGGELVIHNAPFDAAFLDHELELLGGRLGRLTDHCTVFDTLALARELHPGQRNTLDALCRRYAVDDSGRELHGALLDAELLAEVYLAMTGGQATLDLVTAVAPGPVVREGAPAARERPPLRVIHADAEELEAHERRLDAIDTASGGRCAWRAPGWGNAPGEG